MDGSRSLVKGHPILLERVWNSQSLARVELFLFDKYRQGIHPDIVEFEIREEIAITQYGRYTYHYLKAMLDMHLRLQLAGHFRGLPSLNELDSVERILDKRIRLEQMIKDRFMRQDMASMMRQNMNMESMNRGMPCTQHAEECTNLP
jgi:hypothetical protein